MGKLLQKLIDQTWSLILGCITLPLGIPQAARFLFMQNKMRMICDCRATPVNVIQSQELTQPLCLVGSTLRASHECHSQFMVNMGSIASLVMSVIINGSDAAGGGIGRNSMKLWGLVVCHHTSPWAVPFPHRYACEYLMQAFGLQLSIESQLAAQLKEKHIFRIQMLLCEMLLRDGPIGIVTQSPSIMDLVKCDGAALYYRGMCWMLGMTPTEAQIVDIADWLLEYHGDSTGINTDSLTDAGYPGATYLGDPVCGMAAARINSKDFVFWFRSQTAKELKAGDTENQSSDEISEELLSVFLINLRREMRKARGLPGARNDNLSVAALVFSCCYCRKEKDNGGEGSKRLYNSMSVENTYNGERDEDTGNGEPL